MQEAVHGHINFMSFPQSAPGGRNDRAGLTYVAIFLTLYFLLSAICPVHAAQKNVKETIALFPFENLSGDKNALAVVMPAVKVGLEAKGFEVLDEGKLNDFLLRERIRNTGYVTGDLAARLGEELHVKAVLVGSINSFLAGEDPRIGISARLVGSSDGAVLWANHSSASGDDFTTILGLGKVTSIDGLSARVADDLFDSFRTDFAGKQKEATYRVAVMPFQNGSEVKDAGMVATYLFITELFKDKEFMPVEYGDVRRLVVDLRISEKGELDFKKAERMSRSTGIDGIIVGSVDIYREKDGTAPPEAEISARLIDARRGKILWCDSFGLKGDDDTILLDWGKKNTAEEVAREVVSRLAKGMDKARWN